jgi:hypothetical protein
MKHERTSLILTDMLLYYYVKFKYAFCENNEVDSFKIQCEPSLSAQSSLDVQVFLKD